ncbi:MAG: glycosyltransferase, partial [Candidatus Aenigmatarchaeota archaeon]
MLSIIIPTKNEPCINDLIKDIRKKVKQKHEIIVVDKSDAVPEIRGAKLVRQKSDGLGAAVLEGVAASKGGIILMMDGDGSHDPAYIDKMFLEMKNNDIVIGSRYVDGGSSSDMLSRVIVSKLLTAAVSIVLGLGIKDPMSGFAMYRRSVLGKIRLNPKGYKLLME